MAGIAWTLDLLLVFSLTGLAAGSLAARNLFASVALFIAFGLLMALTWARLGTVDIALAEAAIGAGLTGALLMLAMQCMEGRSGAGAGRGPEDADQRARGLPLARRYFGVVTAPLLGLLLVLLAAMGGAAVWLLPRESAGLTPLVESRLAESGVEHSVTAVLLNFRGYDTLLELTVLLLAAIGVHILRAQTGDSAAAVWGGEASDPVLRGLIRVAAPLIVFLALYLLWLGSHAPGGAFQGGALLGAGSVLLFLGAVAAPRRTRGIAARVLLVAGLTVFLATGVATLMLGRPLLEYPPGWAKPLIVVIEAAAMLSIATVFAALFAALLPGEIQPPLKRSGEESPP